MVEYQQQLESYDRKLKELENDLRPKVEWLTQEMNILLQPKKSLAAKLRWKVRISRYSSGQKSYYFRLVPCSVDGAWVLFRARFVPYYHTVPQ